METNSGNIEEVWKVIPEFSKYEASNLGRLKTFNWKGSGRESIIKPCSNGGYLKTVLINDSGKKCTIKVHRIIAKTFISNIEGFEVNHKNAIKHDNRVTNLEWCTRQENIKHSKDNNLQVILLGEQVGNSVLKESQVLEIRKKFKPRIVTREMLGLEYGVSPTTIKDIILRKSWKHLK